MFLIENHYSKTEIQHFLKRDYINKPFFLKIRNFRFI